MELNFSLKLDMVKAELELYEEQCNSVAKKLQEATASLQKITEESEAKKRCLGTTVYTSVMCVWF